MQNNSEIRKKWFIEQVEKLKESGTSYAEIAGKLNVKPQYLNGIINGDRGAAEKFVNKFCEAFHINQNELLNRQRVYTSEPTSTLVSEFDNDKKRLIPFYDDVLTKGGIDGGVVDVNK